MEELLTYLWNESHWMWWAIAVLLLGIEVLLPTFFILWLGVAGVVVGFIAFFLPELSWQNQVIIFTILAVVITVVGRRVFRPQNLESDRPGLNIRGADMIGRKYTTEQAFKDGQGSLNIGDSRWMARSEDGEPIKKDVRVEIVNVDASVLVVKPVSPEEK